MIILQKGNHRAHREPGDISPRGEPWPPPSVLTPQSPCTVERAVGVGTLYRDTIYASAATTNVRTKPTRKRISPGDTTPGFTHTHTLQGVHHFRRLRASSQRLYARAGLACVQAYSGAAPASCNRCGCGWAYVGRAHHGRAGHPYAHISPHEKEEDNENTKHLTN